MTDPAIEIHASGTAAEVPYILTRRSQEEQLDQGEMFYSLMTKASCESATRGWSRKSEP